METWSNREAYLLEAHELGHSFGIPHRDREATPTEYHMTDPIIPTLPQHLLMCPLNIFTEHEIDQVKKYQAGKRFRMEDEKIIFPN